jgi:hypothetical protein
MFLDVLPYYMYPEGNEGYFNYDWIELRKILYSFTEDSNGNGRLDRIRVQTNISLNGDFSGFDVIVEGYEVNRSVYDNGFRMVSDATGIFDNDSFYIYLIENINIDGGNIPLWSVTRNTSLKDLLTGTSYVGEPQVDIDLRPYDTIPPRIAYALTLPGHPQTYIRMSEPVVSGPFSAPGLSNSTTIETTSPYTFTWIYTPYDGELQQFSAMVPGANLGFILQWQSPFSIDTLAGLNNIFGDTTVTALNGYFAIDNVYDQAQRPIDWSDAFLDPVYNVYYQAPKFPLNWGYTEYAFVFGNRHMLDHMPDSGFSPDIEAVGANGPIPLRDVFIPPNRLLTAEMMTLLASGNGANVTPASFSSYSNSSAIDRVVRRVTDVLVSIPPNNNNSSDYFAWPVWARYQIPPSAAGYVTENDFWGQLPTDTGIIWIFDGTAYLEAENVEVQARVNSGLTNRGLEFFWAANIPAESRNPVEAPARGRSLGGLWLPNILSLNGNQPLYYYSPFYTGAIGRVPPANSTSPLFTFRIDQASPPGYSSGDKIEFVMRFTNPLNQSLRSDMFIARLDIQHGSAIPENWYTLVRPFSFDIQNIRQQRGGVTILNNVINSNNRENTYIRYNMLRPGRVTVQVYTLDGTLVRSIRRNEHRVAGEWTDAWDGTNNGGRPVARGMYFIRVVAPDIDEIRKVMVVR